jgi:hypothetical protein
VNCTSCGLPIPDGQSSCLMCISCEGNPFKQGDRILLFNLIGIVLLICLIPLFQPTVETTVESGKTLYIFHRNTITEGVNFSTDTIISASDVERYKTKFSSSGYVYTRAYHIHGTGYLVEKK